MTTIPLNPAAAGDETAAAVKPDTRPIPQAPPSGGRRYEFLDGLRGLAIIGVILVHVSHMIAGLNSPLSHLAVYGGRGVQLFFVVSGFTLTINYVDRPFDAASFFIRRVFRIAPIFYLGGLFFIAWGQWTTLPFGVHDATGFQILTALTFTHGWFPSTIHAIVPGGWSIAAEMMFYVVFPALLLLLRRPYLFLVATLLSYPLSIVFQKVAIAALGTRATAGNWSGFFWLSELPAFMTGCSLFVIEPWLSKRPRLAKAVLAGVVLAFPVVIYVAPSFLNACALFGAFVVSAAVLQPRFLALRGLVLTGQVSFSIYIVHFVFVSMLAPLASPVVGRSGPNLAFVALSIVVYVLSLLTSILTYRWIELPMIALGKRVVRKLKTR